MVPKGIRWSNKGAAYADQKQQHAAGHQQVAHVQQAVRIERLMNHQVPPRFRLVRPHLVRAPDRYSSAAAGPKNS